MRYTKLLTVFLAAFFMLVPVLVLLPGKANAMPASFCLGGLCETEWEWPAGGFNHGLAATISDPTVISVQDGAVVDWVIQDCNNAPSCNGGALIGLEFRGNSPPGGIGPCSAKGSGSFYFYISPNGSGCIPVPSGDHGHAVLLKEGYYTSGGGGMFFQVTGPNGQEFCAPNSACFVGGDLQSYTGVVDYFAEYNGSGPFTSTQFTGRQAYDNQYQNSSGVWTYVHSDPSKIFQGQPPYSSWQPYPTQSTTGGDWFFCMEANNNNFC